MLWPWIIGTWPRPPRKSDSSERTSRVSWKSTELNFSGALDRVRRKTSTLPTQSSAYKKPRIPQPIHLSDAVIPEGAQRLSGIQQNHSLLDTGSRPPQADSSGMTIVFAFSPFLPPNIPPLWEFPFFYASIIYPVFFLYTPDDSSSFHLGAKRNVHYERLFFIRNTEG